MFASVVYLCLSDRSAGRVKSIIYIYFLCPVPSFLISYCKRGRAWEKATTICWLPKDFDSHMQPWRKQAKAGFEPIVTAVMKPTEPWSPSDDSILPKIEQKKSSLALIYQCCRLYALDCNILGIKWIFHKYCYLCQLLGPIAYFP